MFLNYSTPLLQEAAILMIIFGEKYEQSQLVILDDSLVLLLSMDVIIFSVHRTSGVIVAQLLL